MVRGGDVSRQNDGSRPIGKLFEPIPSPRCYHYLSTGPAKGLGESLSETGRGSGDESYPSRQNRHHVIIALGSGCTSDQHTARERRRFIYPEVRDNRNLS